MYVRENAYDIVLNTRWVFSVLVSEVQASPEGSAWTSETRTEKNPSRIQNDVICI